MFFCHRLLLLRRTAFGDQPLVEALSFPIPVSSQGFCAFPIDYAPGHFNERGFSDPLASPFSYQTHTNPGIDGCMIRQIYNNSNKFLVSSPMTTLRAKMASKLLRHSIQFMIHTEANNCNGRPYRCSFYCPNANKEGVITCLKSYRPF